MATVLTSDNYLNISYIHSTREQSLLSTERIPTTLEKTVLPPTPAPAAHVKLKLAKKAQFLVPPKPFKASLGINLLSARSQAIDSPFRLECVITHPELPGQLERVQMFIENIFNKPDYGILNEREVIVLTNYFYPASKAAKDLIDEFPQGTVTKEGIKEALRNDMKKPGYGYEYSIKNEMELRVSQFAINELSVAMPGKGKGLMYLLVAPVLSTKVLNDMKLRASLVKKIMEGAEHYAEQCRKEFKKLKSIIAELGVLKETPAKEIAIFSKYVLTKYELKPCLASSSFKINLQNWSENRHSIDGKIFNLQNVPLRNLKEIVKVIKANAKYFILPSYFNHIKERTVEKRLNEGEFYKRSITNFFDRINKEMEAEALKQQKRSSGIINVAAKKYLPEAPKEFTNESLMSTPVEEQFYFKMALSPHMMAVDETIRNLHQERERLKAIHDYTWDEVRDDHWGVFTKINEKIVTVQKYFEAQSLFYIDRAHTVQVFFGGLVNSIPGEMNNKKFYVGLQKTCALVLEYLTYPDLNEPQNNSMNDELWLRDALIKADPIRLNPEQTSNIEYVIEWERKIRLGISKASPFLEDSTSSKSKSTEPSTESKKMASTTKLPNNSVVPASAAPRRLAFV